MELCLDVDQKMILDPESLETYILFLTQSQDP